MDLPIENGDFPSFFVCFPGVSSGWNPASGLVTDWPWLAQSSERFVLKPGCHKGENDVFFGGRYHLVI